MIDEIRYFFYISNDPPNVPAEKAVFECNKHCDQENLISHQRDGSLRKATTLASPIS